MRYLNAKVDRSESVVLHAGRAGTQIAEPGRVTQRHSLFALQFVYRC